MKAKKAIYILTAALTMGLAVCAYAATMNQLSFVERFETGKVDIDVQELSVIKEGEEAEATDIVEANKDVSYIPRIINRNADCYIRASVEVVMDGECQEPLSTEHIYGMNGDWISKGGYFYCTKVLKKGEHTDLFEGIHIPEDWDYGEADGFTVSVNTEAVQSANFMPDFSKEMPWGAVELNDVAKASGSEYTEARPTSAISDAEYTSGGGFQCNTSELFDEFTGMMPGSKYEKNVNLKNASRGTLKVFLKVSAKDSELNKKLQLRITAGGEEVYDGAVAGSGKLENLKVMDIPKGESGPLKLELGLPADTDNTYVQLQDDIVWTLEVEEVPDESTQTGDMSDILPYAAAALLAVILMIYLAGGKRRGENETGH